jgi:hypothetical protein
MYGKNKVAEGLAWRGKVHTPDSRDPLSNHAKYFISSDQVLSNNNRIHVRPYMFYDCSRLIPYISLTSIRGCGVEISTPYMTFPSHANEPLTPFQSLDNHRNMKRM